MDAIEAGGDSRRQGEFPDYGPGRGGGSAVYCGKEMCAGGYR